MPNRNRNRNQDPASQKHGQGRGFAGMDPETQRAIASAGGRAAHASGHAHEFTSEEAREAGRKGGEASGGNRSQGNRSVAASRSGGSDRDIQGGSGDEVPEPRSQQ